MRHRQLMLVLLVVLVGSGFMYADTFNTLTTWGCFGTSCTPSSATAYFPSSNNWDLKFQGSNGGPAVQINPPVNFDYFVQLGTFNLRDIKTIDPLSGNFVADVRFGAPTGIASGQNYFVDGTFTGMIKQKQNGSIDIDFNNASELFTYSFNAGTKNHPDIHSGIFYVTVPDVQMSFSAPGGLSGAETPWIAQVSSSPVPEPTSLALFGSGLLSLAGFARRRFFNK